MKANLTRDFVFVEVGSDGVNNLLLQIAQVFALCRNAPQSRPGRPKRQSNGPILRRK